MVNAMGRKLFFVYFMASHTKTLYVGVTCDLKKRYLEHCSGEAGGFTSRYNVKKLVYFETGRSSLGAIRREKQIKGWVRAKKIALVDSVNSEWRDLGKEL